MEPEDTPTNPADPADEHAALEAEAAAVLAPLAARIAELDAERASLEAEQAELVARMHDDTSADARILKIDSALRLNALRRVACASRLGLSEREIRAAAEVNQDPAALAARKLLA